jgi:hypothetical protein
MTGSAVPIATTKKMANKLKPEDRLDYIKSTGNGL